MDERAKQLRSELQAVGAGSVALRTPEARRLATLLHPNEHIGGVVYGRYSAGLAWLVATDQRVLFIDSKPLFTTTDELTYDVIAGIKSNHAGPFSSVILHTRLGDYAIRFVNRKCARIFIAYIEARQLESTKEGVVAPTLPPPVDPVFQSSSKDALNFLKEHDLATLSTVDRTGNVHGAIVYYLVDQENHIYILTKADSGKGRNVYAHSQVALTIHEAGTTKTVQLEGMAEIETDQTIKNNIFAQMIKLRPYRDGAQLPPVTKLHEGAYMVIRITPLDMKYHDYAQSS